MARHLELAGKSIRARKRVYLLVSMGFFVIYYLALLLATMLRFGEIPNYVVFHDIIEIYGLIMQGTPSLRDAIPILLDEAWFETGYKNPLYYGVATWSYMLIPPKMLLVLLMGNMLGLLTVVSLYKQDISCNTAADKKLFAAAGLGTTFVALTSATLTWVVCCATPSWVVALAMLGMSASLALWLEPLGNVLTVSGVALVALIIILQLKQLEITTSHRPSHG